MKIGVKSSLPPERWDMIKKLEDYKKFIPKWTMEFIKIRNSIGDNF